MSVIALILVAITLLPLNMLLLWCISGIIAPAIGHFVLHRRAESSTQHSGENVQRRTRSKNIKEGANEKGVQQTLPLTLVTTFLDSFI